MIKESYIKDNIFILLTLLGLMFVSPPIIYKVWSVFQKQTELVDPRAKLELYKEYDWTEDFYNEFHSLDTEYKDYISWRRKDFKGNTINITNGIRKTVLDSSIIEKKEFWFFGGSTTWGAGVNDSLTYPSIFSNKNNIISKNFGETGYVARQSLAYLVNYLISEDRDLTGINIVFYDGVNDVLMRCRSEINGLATGYEVRFRDIIESQKSFEIYSFKTTFNQLQLFVNSVKKRLYPHKRAINYNDYFDCDKNHSRKLEIINSLLNTWSIASEIVEDRGGSFTAILQPVAHYGQPKVDYLNLNSDYEISLNKQYESIYSILTEKIKKSDINVIDFTGIFDNCENCYIDFCHVGPLGNELLANKLSELEF